MLPLALFLLAAAAPDSTCNVRDHGAVGDGRANDRAAIQKAIDACAAAGGGVVVVPAGNYLSGSLVLRSNITFRLTPGATLTGSRRMEDYDPPHLLSLHGAENVAIDGGGRIHASGDAFWKDRVDHPYFLGLRPRPSPMLEIFESHRVRVENVTIRDTPGWGIHIARSEDVSVRGVTLVSHLRGPNTDGIDIDSSSNVRIADCSIEGGDDAIVIKTPARAGLPARPAENIVITNCVMTSTSNCFKLGTESATAFRNIALSNCVMYKRADAFRAPISGIAIESVDGAEIDGITVSNVTMRDVSTPIFIRLGNRGRGMKAPQPGSIQNVSISNVTATGALLTNSIHGLPGHPVRRIDLSNIHVTMRGGEVRPRSLDVAELADIYPEAWMFGTLPAYGLYARHAEDLTLANLQLRWEKEDVRPAVVLDDVRDIGLHGFHTDTAVSASPVLHFHNTVQALVTDPRVPPAAKAVLEVTGPRSRDVREK